MRFAFDKHDTSYRGEPGGGGKSRQAAADDADVEMFAHVSTMIDICTLHGKGQASPILC
jgi:hypothetical protein